MSSLSKPAAALDPAVRAELERRSGCQGPQARRARIVLLSAQGATTRQIAQALGLSPPTVRLWRGRFEAEGLEGLGDRPRCGRPRGSRRRGGPQAGPQPDSTAEVPQDPLRRRSSHLAARPPGPEQPGACATPAPPADDLPNLLHVPRISLPQRVHHDAHLLLWCLRGMTRVVLPSGRGRRTMTLVGDQAAWIPAGTAHRLVVEENSAAFPLLFDTDQTATTLDRIVHLAISPELGGLLLALFQAQNTLLQPQANLERQALSMIEAATALDAGAGARGQGLGLAPEASDRQARQRAAPDGDDRPPAGRSQAGGRGGGQAGGAAGQVMAALAFNPGDDRGIEQLAALAHVSPRTVQRDFARQTGMTLRQWRTRSRLEAAARMLDERTTPQAVAHRVGYQSVTAFYRAFKRHFGLTPGAYVRASRGQEPSRQA